MLKREVSLLNATTGAKLAVHDCEPLIVPHHHIPCTRRVIGVNTRESYRRRRFTVGHEIGHLLLHDQRGLTVDQTVRVHKRDDVSSMATNREEIEANGFAAALLMPEAVIATAARDHFAQSARTSRDDLVSTLAREFDVSTEAMGYRLINLGMLSP